MTKKHNAALALPPPPPSSPAPTLGHRGDPSGLGNQRETMTVGHWRLLEEILLLLVGFFFIIFFLMVSAAICK